MMQLIYSVNIIHNIKEVIAMNLKSSYPLMDKAINKKGKKINNLEAIMNQMSQNCLHTCDKRLLFSIYKLSNDTSTSEGALIRMSEYPDDDMEMVSIIIIPNLLFRQDVFRVTFSNPITNESTKNLLFSEQVKNNKVINNINNNYDSIEFITAKYINYMNADAMNTYKQMTTNEKISFDVSILRNTDFSKSLDNDIESRRANLFKNYDEDVRIFSFIEKFQGIFDYICNIKEVEEDEIISIMDKLSMKHMQYDI